MGITISTRTEKDGREPSAQHIEDGKWVLDPVWDDVSVIPEITIIYISDA